jgi:PD-(D/E)XK nuclease superfamily
MNGYYDVQRVSQTFLKSVEWAIRNGVDVKHLKLTKHDTPSDSMQRGRLIHSLLSGDTKKSDLQKKSVIFAGLSDTEIAVVHLLRQYTTNLPFEEVYAMKYKTPCKPDRKVLLQTVAGLLTPSLQVLTDAMFDSVINQIDQIERDSDIQALYAKFNDSLPQLTGKEVELYADVIGVQCKGMVDEMRYDAKTKTLMILDYKTCNRDFFKAIADEDYIRQLAFYRVLALKTARSFNYDVSHVETYLYGISDEGYTKLVRISDYDLECATDRGGYKTPHSYTLGYYDTTSKQITTRIYLDDRHANTLFESGAWVDQPRSTDSNYGHSVEELLNHLKKS